ncbi:hypothetical protein [Thermosulfurimonas sp.]|uniref:LeuA family protein n=1 Tax=Thermosulfurimonas sp. TaxID=2080236 RepID=UPI0025EF23E2|nr:hypothetical protein [Thermosulfurimonas sp.]
MRALALYQVERFLHLIPVMRLMDTTLREGIQRWGVYFPFRVRREIVRYLAEIGIEEVELGVVGEERLRGLLLSCRRFPHPPTFSVWLRLRKEDIEKAARLPEVGFNLSVPVSELQIRRRLRLDPGTLLKKTEELISLAARYSPCVTLGLEDASRAEESFILQICRVSLAAGARRIRISDTLGLLHPLEVIRLVELLKKAFPETEVGFHGHNDFGLATANAVAALLGGADWVDVSVLGLGERAGIASLEEVLAYLYFRQKCQHYRLELLPKLSHYVAWQAGEVIPEFRPVVGRKLFYCESGLHVDGLKKAPELYEPFPPELLGLKRKFSLGAKSGRAALRALLKEWQLDCPEEKLGHLLREIRRRASELGRPLGPEEIKHLLDSLQQK